MLVLVALLGNSKPNSFPFHWFPPGYSGCQEETTAITSTVLVCVVMMSMVLWPRSGSIDALQVLPLPVMVDQLS